MGGKSKLEKIVNLVSKFDKTTKLLQHRICCEMEENSE